MRVTGYPLRVATLVEFDDRRRASFGKLGHHDRYMAEELADGTIVLHPAVIVSEMQLRLMASPEFYQQITEANALPTEALLRRPRRQRRTDSPTP